MLIIRFNYLSQRGTEQKVIVETGENIFNAIEISVDGDLLL